MLSISSIAEQLNVNVHFWGRSSAVDSINDDYCIFIDNRLNEREQWQEFCHQMYHYFSDETSYNQLNDDYGESKVDYFMCHFCVTTFMQLEIKVGTAYVDQDFVVATKSGTIVLPTNIARAYRLISNKLEIKHIRFHNLRHTHASLLFKQNVHPKIVQERLGHSSIETTLGTYSHMLPNMQESAAQKSDEKFDEKGKNSDMTNWHFSH